MTNDFGVDFATELTEYFTAGTDITAPPATVYVTLYDDTGTELNGSLQNGRVGVTVGSGWTKTNTAFENAAEINFGEVTGGSTITVQETPTTRRRWSTSERTSPTRRRTSPTRRVSFSPLASCRSTSSTNHPCQHER